VDVTDADFERAVKNIERMDEKAAQHSSKEPQVAGSENEKTPDFPGFSAPCDIVHFRPVEVRGFEPLTS
jgi:hypothetical protein